MSEEAERIMEIFLTQEEQEEVKKVVTILKKYGFRIDVEEDHK